MTISEYEFFGVPRDPGPFLGAVRNHVAVLRHEHGDSLIGPVPRTMQVEWSVKNYERTGDKQHLIEAAAWLCAEWGG